VRALLRKIYRQQPLLAEEIDRLMDYASELGRNSPPSYTLFYDRFAALLFNHYNLFLPALNTGFDDWIDFLLAHPEIRQKLRNRPMVLAEFPTEMRKYLLDTYGDLVNCGSLIVELETDLSHDTAESDLPAPRLAPLTCKFESGNPFKEVGLKAHFDRIGRYSFVSRIHSIRYLTGAKAREDRLEVVSGDCLAGIFTNKEKSIYYYVFLTEKDENKARNACRVLNRALYEYHAEQ
jgi:hypothetical protein